jgi:hypothetical protein
MFMQFVHFVIGSKDQVDAHKLQHIAFVLQGLNTRLIFEYEQKLGHLSQLNSKLIQQLQSYLHEMMHFSRQNKDLQRLELLKEQDHALSQYQLEA